MKPQTFESYLEEVHMEDYHGIGDNAPDAFERWVEQLDVSEVMEYAEDYGIKMFAEAYNKGGNDAMNEVNRLASNPN